MKEILISMICGIVVGAIFKYFRLPTPAPTAIAGIMGILGIWIGATLVTMIIEKSRIG